MMTHETYGGREGTQRDRLFICVNLRDLRAVTLAREVARCETEDDRSGDECMWVFLLCVRGVSAVKRV